MLRRITTLVAIAAMIAPAAAARANDWEEDYSDEWRDESPPPDDYPVSVDVDASASVTFDTFQGALSPYGEWVVAGSYGPLEGKVFRLGHMGTQADKGLVAQALEAIRKML